jgi:simple sugar transport system permease protein
VNPATFFRSSANTLITFALLTAFFVAFTPNHIFLDARNLTSVWRLLPDLGIVALGIGLLMICGEFDLSVSATIPLSAFCFATLATSGMSPELALGAALLTGAGLGLINGLLVVVTRMPSFIITLATLMFWRGVTYVASGMAPIRITAVTAEHPWFRDMFTGSVGPVPAQVIWFLGLAAILGVLLQFHRVGNWIYATGSNRAAARAMGINTGAVIIGLYVLTGILCVLVGVMQAVRSGGFASTQGASYELLALAAVAVGGVPFKGGVGTVLNILLGVLIIKFLSNGLILMNIPVFGIDVFVGAAIVLFVILNNFVQRRMA